MSPARGRSNDSTLHGKGRNTGVILIWKGKERYFMRVKRQYYEPEKDGFYGAFYECPSDSDRAVILMLGDAIDDRMAVSGVKWLHQQKCHVMAMSPDKKDYGHHNYPLERFGKAIEVIQKKDAVRLESSVLPRPECWHYSLRLIIRRSV